jgi:hypothetical protein
METDDSYNNGFLYSNGVYTMIDVLGSYTTQPVAINDYGQIIGDYAPIPERSTWVMMLLSFAGLGFLRYPASPGTAALKV